jgi:chromosome segregation protein
VTEAATAVAAAEGGREAARSQRAQRAEERRQAIARMEQRQTLLAQVRREREDIALSLRDLRERLANNRAALAEREQAVAPAHAALADTLGEQRELAAGRGDAQARLFGAERETLAAEAELRQRAQQVQALLTQIADEGLVTRADGSVRSVVAAVDGAGLIVADARTAVAMPAAGGAEVDTEALRARISDLRAEIRALGPVNIDALDDLSEERERHHFLTAQVGDLEAAEVELREAIRDLEKLIRTRFDETFALVNTNFEHYFQRFFGGGSATLRIVEPEDEDGEAGVEITAQPPGKRIASLSVLSGGERSLTSVALLFALLAVNPAPVCVLDEVDAALDEANVGRFVETLLELTLRSQFVVITHNRRTVEAADTIYGVSMGDESTSQVLSLSVADLPVAS